MKKGANSVVILILIAIVVFGGNVFWPDARDASRMHVTLTPAEKPAPPGLTPGNFRGIWDLANTLHVEASRYFEKDGNAITGADYPDTQKPATLHMTRGAEPEFQVACGRVKQTG